MTWISNWWYGRNDDPTPSNANPANVTAASQLFHEKAQIQLDMLARFVKESSNVVSPAVYSRLRSIDDVVRPLIKFLATHDIVAEQEIAIEYLLTRYIPEPLNTFVLLQQKDREENGKADTLLLQQYDTLEKSTRELADGIYKRTMSDLNTYAIFIEEKFGKQ